MGSKSLGSKSKASRTAVFSTILLFEWLAETRLLSDPPKNKLLEPLWTYWTRYQANCNSLLLVLECAASLVLYLPEQRNQAARLDFLMLRDGHGDIPGCSKLGSEKGGYHRSPYHGHFMQFLWEQYGTMMTTHQIFGTPFLIET